MKSLVIELHKWEGVSFVRHTDLFYSSLKLGFISVLVLRQRWTVLAAELAGQLKRLRGELG